MKVGLLGLSNPCSYKEIESVKERLEKKGYEVVVSSILDKDTDGFQRASLFNKWMAQGFDEIYDVSGGDLANETLPYLDLEVYKKSKTIFYGYSDLTCVLNVLSPIRPCVLFQIRNSEKIEYNFSYQGSSMSGMVVGGNIRCLLKLAGTPYFPNCENKILFLESYSGDAYRIRTYFSQLALMGVFNQIKGLLLGQFSECDRKGIPIDFYSDYYRGAVGRTMEIGHGMNSKALWIGKEIEL